VSNHKAVTVLKQLLFVEKMYGVAMYFRHRIHLSRIPAPSQSHILCFCAIVGTRATGTTVPGLPVPLQKKNRAYR
jgi:hypothetical protein